VKIVAVVQARTASTRLPKKVLLPVAGRPLLELMLNRVRAAQQIDEVVVATTSSAADDSIRTLTAHARVACVSGHPTDLIDRHLQAAVATGADVVVKIPSDCPLIDPRVIDEVVGTYRRQSQRCDFVSNLHPATWPDGNDVEVFPRHVLEQAWREAARSFEREHTTPFIWDRPDRFRIANVTAPDGRDRSGTHRLTLDYQEDYALIAAVFQAFSRPEPSNFSVEEIVAFLDTHPEISGLNARFRGTGWVDQHRHELKTLWRRGVAAPAVFTDGAQP
jgi:spore coat polysaccharide biosynthesis protein SpsF